MHSIFEFLCVNYIIYFLTCQILLYVISERINPTDRTIVSANIRQRYQEPAWKFCKQRRAFIELKI